MDISDPSRFGTGSETGKIVTDSVPRHCRFGTTQFFCVRFGTTDCSYLWSILNTENYCLWLTVCIITLFLWSSFVIFSVLFGIAIIQQQHFVYVKKNNKVFHIYLFYGFVFITDQIHSLSWPNLLSWPNSLSWLDYKLLCSVRITSVKVTHEFCDFPIFPYMFFSLDC